MDRFIVNSTAADPLGIPTGRKCLVVKSGQSANRVAILYAASATALALVWADPPYSDFSSPVNVITDSADSPFDAYMDNNGDVYIAYTIATSKHLGFVKLTYDGSWSVGTPVTVYNADENYNPTIMRLSSEYLWIAYTRLSGGNRYISAKSSSDGGSSWGTISDPGDTLTSGATEAYAVMVEAGDYQYVFYTEGGTKIAYRRKLNAGAIWNSEVSLASGSGFDEHLAAAVDPDGRIGVAYISSGDLKFREYSGSAWSGEYALDENVVNGPAVSYQGGVPYVLFMHEYGTNMNMVMYTKMTETVFHSPVPLDSRKSYLQKLLVYDASAGTYQDKTGEAASTNTADVFHTSSGGIVSAVGDAVFVGMDEPFHFLNFVLSTAGSGGEVVWKYWDGQAWKAFTPASGPWHFTTTQQGLLLWNDFLSLPGDWQKKSISDYNHYWISAAVTSAFTTAPVGTQISAVSNLKALSVQV
jgi:hypothetical protein